MDLMDLLLADALAAGLARQAAREAQRPPPDNFFILPPDPEAWNKLYDVCKKEHMVICIEITDDGHAPSRRVQPLIVDLAREISQIPFFRAKVGLGRSYEKLRRDLGGVQYIPTIVIVFFGDDDVYTKKAEGEEEIRLALRVGAFEKIIKDYIEKRIGLKLAERLAGAVADDIARQRRQASIEYEQKLKKEKDEIDAKVKARQVEQEKALEEERRKRLEAERKAEEAKHNEQKAKLKAYVVDELLQMDLKKTKISVIKEKMNDLGISDTGCLSRDDLITRLKSNVPALKTKLDQDSISPNSFDSTPSSYTTTTRQPSFTDNLKDSGSLKRNDSNEFSRLEMKVKSLEENIDELDAMRDSLHTENSRLESKLREKDEVIRKKENEITELKNMARKPFESGSKVKELEDELLETRMLYTCTLDDIDIFALLAKSDEGAVVRAKCTKPGLPNPSRVYALKIVNDVMGTSTLSRVRSNYKVEYEILSGLPPHKNIVHLYAFFYDRPKTHRKLQMLGEGIGLFILMEQLTQNMKGMLDTLRRGPGPASTKVIGWLRDVLCGLEYLYSHHIVHRDLKLDNLMLSGDTLKLVDFGNAIKLDSSMTLQYTCALPRGGNDAHLAPEILNTRPGPRKVLNYTKQPVWAAGVLAYELAGHESPFSKVDQRAYDISSISSLSSTYCQGSGRPQVLPRELTNLVESMLEYDPDKRPTIGQTFERVSKLV